MAEREIHADCIGCGAHCHVPAVDIVNTKENPELKEKVLSGELFMWKCPSCGTVNLAHYPLLYHDPDTKLLFWLSDGDAAVEAQMAAAIKAQGLEDYTCRIVDNPGDLLEKIKIFDAGLDDIAMEMCKFVTRGELNKDVDLKFFQIDGPDHEIILAYPENEQMQMVQIGFNVYEDSAAILRRNPDLTEKATGLVRIDRQWLESFMA